MTPSMVKSMPASTVTAPVTAPPSSPAAALACEAGSTARPTVSAAGRAAERSSTGGVLIHARACALTRGAAHTAASAPIRHRVHRAARCAARLWEWDLVMGTYRLTWGFDRVARIP